METFLIRSRKKCEDLANDKRQKEIEAFYCSMAQLYVYEKFTMEYGQP